MSLIRAIRQNLAARLLAKLVEASRNSFAVQDYAKRRQAMLKVTRA